jgi:type I restriction enzyme S subunit
MYLYYLLHTEEFKKFSSYIGTGLKVFGITFFNFAKYETKMPMLPEQTSIGSFFRTLDDTILLYKRKLDSLKQLKKAYLQQMFPQERETVPKVRFAGFTGEWIQQTINDIADVVTGSTPPTKEREVYNGGYLFVSPSDIQGNRYIETTTNTLSAEGFNKGRKIKQGASFFVCIGSTIGKIAQATIESVTNQQINSIIGKDCMNDDFIYTLLEKESEKIRKFSATQAVPIINKTTFENIILTLPEIREEQKAVGNFFCNLDEQIATQQTKLNNLKQLKSAYLQKMFV